MTRESNKEKSAIDGLENIKRLLEYYEENPDATVGVKEDYYHLKSVVDAYRDIQLRKSLGATTIADGLLLSLICYSFRVYG